jgi:hypothetical protein
MLKIKLNKKKGTVDQYNPALSFIFQQASKKIYT